ncbi:MAG: glycosyltransferase family 2 protein [Proteobacteria bacterium]|nr:glycosyltransferase family 2 protein [Pseudomonadota bacterium]
MTDVARSHIAAARSTLYRAPVGVRYPSSQASSQPTEAHAAKLSIVVAAFNEEGVIGELYSRLKRVLASLPYGHELIVVDDGSTDGTARRVNALAEVDPAVLLVELSRNFGKEAAVSAGIAHATGDAVILIDADLEHPPELIPSLVAQWERGADVVVGVRNPRASEGFVRRVASRGFAYLMNRISEVPAPARATDFRLIDRAVADEFRRLPEQKRLTRSLIDWLGFHRAYVPFDAGTRAGKSRYGYARLASAALSAILAHSRAPLYLVGYLGAAITLLALLAGGFVWIEQFAMHDPLRLEVSGAAMLSILILFLNGITLSCLGLMGLYIGTIREEIAGRPLYIVRPSRANSSRESPPSPGIRAD